LFESPSQLKRIESRTFYLFGIEIAIPSTILFIASDALPNPFQITFEDWNSCPDFDRWQHLRKKNIASDFPRMGKFDLDLADLKAHLMVISKSEEQSVEGGSGQVFSEI
jgi:hypothetical protein